MSILNPSPRDWMQQHDTQVSRGHWRRQEGKDAFWKLAKLLRCPTSPQKIEIIFSKSHPDFLCPLGRVKPDFSSSYHQHIPLLCIYFQLCFPLFTVTRTSNSDRRPFCLQYDCVHRSNLRPSKGRYVISIRGRRYRIYNRQYSLSRYGQLITICLCKNHNEFRNYCLPECFHH